MFLLGDTPDGSAAHSGWVIDLDNRTKVGSSMHATVDTWGTAGTLPC